MNLRLPVPLAWALILAALTLPAFAKVDLSRVAPVPADQPIPISDFFRPAILQQPSFNPSGTHIAAIVTAAEDRHQLLVYDLAAKTTEFVSGSGDKDIYAVAWLNDTRLIFNLAARKMYGLGLMAANIGALSDAYPLLQYYGSSVIAIPPQDRLRPLVWNRYDSLETQRDLGVSIINTDLRGGNVVNLVAAGANHSKPDGGLTTGYLADRDGRLAFAFTADQGNLAMHRLADGKWVRCPVDLEQIDVVGAGDAPGQVVVIGPRQADKPRALQFMDAATGQLGDVILQDKAYDFNGWLYRNPATQDIIGAMFNRNGPRSIWFNEDYKALQKILDGFFPGQVVRLIGSNEAQTRFLVACFSDRQPVIYNWVDLEKRTAGLFKNSAPWIDPARMSSVNIIKIKTRDGRSVDGYLTLPAGATKQNPPPLIVLPHGGPWARDYWGYDGEAQFFASRGYAVLKPNYRGSTGINWMFPQEDEWDFAKMHDDVTDATKTMIASGLVDRDRIAIMGASFGGYLAISGVVKEPDLYRCAVTNAGVFDWEDQVRHHKFNQYDSPAFGRLIRKLGNPDDHPEKFAAISPGRQAGRIKVPVFVAGGKDDQTVEITQSRDLISALQKHGVPHETLLVRDEGHGMAHLDNQVELYGRLEAFFAKHLMPKK